MQWKLSINKKKLGIAMLCAGAAFIAVPFAQNAMQGSISGNNYTALNVASLQMQSVTGFEGGGAPVYVPRPASRGGAATFRDMSSNIVTASSGFTSVIPCVTCIFSSSPPGAPQQVQIAPDDLASPYYADAGRDEFPAFSENGMMTVKKDPVSTFSIDVDTASYGVVRRALQGGQVPTGDLVRLEELVNYFPYNYAVPDKGAEHPFLPSVSVFKCPWQPAHKIVHIGIKGYELANKPKSNLVLLLDTSGSMNAPDRLPLVVNSFKMMLDSLAPDDMVSIVTYAGNAGVALDPTPAGDKKKIIDVLDSLNAEGSTAGSEGIQTAYDLAEKNLLKEGNNRVILATDGDFNVGISDQSQLKTFIEGKRDKGIFLSVLGVGQGNYHDSTMQTLAQNGNGNAAYIDNLNEARKVLVEEAGSTLFTIAKDVKIQVEFNPKQVSEYRLLGYETRHLNREDFANDKVDAGEVGAGHAVTAIYEITPAVASPEESSMKLGGAEEGKELAFLKLRYKTPGGSASKLMTRPITTQDEKAFGDETDDVRFATAVAGFGELLRKSKYTGNLSWDDVISMASAARGKDDYGYRAEFVELARLAKTEEEAAK